VVAAHRYQVVLACCSLLAGGPIHAAEPGALPAQPAADLRASRRAAVVTLLATTGVFARARAERLAMIARLRADNPSFPQEVWTNLSRRITSPTALESTYVAIYAKHLTEEDVQGILAFYRTPAGSRFLVAGPKIEEESRTVAQAWATRIVLQIAGKDTDPQQSSSVKAPTASSGSGIEPGQTAAIHELLRASGAVSGAQQIMRAMLERFRHMTPADTLPQSFWTEAARRLSSEGDLLKLWTPAYAHHLSQADITELTRFYRTPTGMRWVAALPAIQEESLAAGEQLARVATHRAIREVLGPLPQWRLAHPQSSASSHSSPAAPPSQPTPPPDPSSIPSGPR
jgi:uncharacterized protein